MGDWKKDSPVVTDWKAEAPVVDEPAPAAEKPPESYASYARHMLLGGGLDKQNEAMYGAIASGLHGAAGAMEGPINGAIAALDEAPKMLTGSRSWDDIVARYRQKRDEVEGAQKENLQRFPHAPIVGAILAGGAGQAPTLPGRLALSTAQGAMYGVGSSKGDLTKGELKQVGKDGLIGGGVGLAGGLLGEGLNAAGRGVGNKLSGVLDKNTAAAQAAADKAVASTRGAYGGEVSSGQRILEMVERAAADPKADPALAASARQFLDSPEGEALLNQVLRSNVGRSGDAMGRIQGARDAMTEAIGNAGPQAVDAAATARLNDPSALTRRLRDLLPKVVLPAAGGALAGPPGAAAGALGAAVLGRSGTTVRKMLADPYVASRALGAGTSALVGAGNAMSHAAPPLGEWSRFLKPEEEQP